MTSATTERVAHSAYMVLQLMMMIASMTTMAMNDDGRDGDGGGADGSGTCSWHFTLTEQNASLKRNRTLLAAAARDVLQFLRPPFSPPSHPSPLTDAEMNS